MCEASWNWRSIMSELKEYLVNRWRGDRVTGPHSVFQSWRRRWFTMMCARIQRSCRAWSTQVSNKQTLQLSVSSKDAYRPWRPREATSVPGELIFATKRCGRVPLTFIYFQRTLSAPLKMIFTVIGPFQGQMYWSVSSGLEIVGNVNERRWCHFPLSVPLRSPIAEFLK